jgi:hypothetical protein
MPNNGNRHLIQVDVGKVHAQIESFRNSLAVRPSFKAATEYLVLRGLSVHFKNRELFPEETNSQQLEKKTPGQHRAFPFSFLSTQRIGRRRPE